MINVAFDPNQRYKISNVFSEASSFGLSGCRTWAFNVGGYQPLQISPGLYDENALAFKDDPTIMAWELINEPRCNVDSSGNTTNDWVQKMAGFVKSIDQNHLLEVGMEEFYGDSMPDRKQNNPGFQVGTHFIKTNLIDQIDFATIHAYPDAW
ncbi:hypothetical protein K1719_010234 [Acacia pycnantha]|nr:hypothetical protein K1719_010234 [Acacia pycnantha]